MKLFAYLTLIYRWSFLVFTVWVCVTGTHLEIVGIVRRISNATKASYTFPLAHRMDGKLKKEVP